MARVAPIHGLGASIDAGALLQLGLVPKAAGVQDGWSIDHEPMGVGWHDSSWMLRKGLDVIEDITPDPLPVEWRHKWRAHIARCYNTSEA